MNSIDYVKENYALLKEICSTNKLILEELRKLNGVEVSSSKKKPAGVPQKMYTEKNFAIPKMENELSFIQNKDLDLSFTIEHSGTASISDDLQKLNELLRSDQDG